MYTLISFEEINQKETPFRGRTVISIYIPENVPKKALIKQLRSEIKRSQLSTSINVKGITIMMLNAIIRFLEGERKEIIPTPGRILFSLPIDHKTSFLSYIKPKKGKIDLFTYNLSENFYIDDNYL